MSPRILHKISDTELNRCWELIDRESPPYVTKNGKVVHLTRLKFKDLLARIASPKVGTRTAYLVKDGLCIDQSNWSGSYGGRDNNYPYFWVIPNTTRLSVHCLLNHFLRGIVPKGQQLNHLADHRCGNPWHTNVGTPRANSLMWARVERYRTDDSFADREVKHHVRFDLDHYKNEYHRYESTSFVRKIYLQRYKQTLQATAECIGVTYATIKSWLRKPIDTTINRETIRYLICRNEQCSALDACLDCFGLNFAHPDRTSSAYDHLTRLLEYNYVDKERPPIFDLVLRYIRRKVNRRFTGRNDLDRRWITDSPPNVLGEIVEYTKRLRRGSLALLLDQWVKMNCFELSACSQMARKKRKIEREKRASYKKRKRGEQRTTECGTGHTHTGAIARRNAEWI